MLTYAIPRIDEKEVAARVAELERKFAPDVVRIRYTIQNDYSGDPAIYFRVLLTDEASTPPGLYRLAQTIDDTVWDELDPLNRWGRIPYVWYRSQSEQSQLREAAWD